MTTPLTRLRRSLGKTWGAVACFLALLAFPAVVFGQGAITTGNMTGRVVDDTGAPVANAAVAVTHLPTGSRINTTTRSNGTFNARSLRAGGPYVVEAEAPGFARSVQRDIFIGLDRAFEVTMVLQADEVIELDEFVVTGSQFDDIFSAGRMGAASLISSRDLENTPVGDRTLNSVLRLDPRIIYNRNPFDQAISAGGLSNRYNQIQIDGVSANDPFGLNSNNTAAERNVVPLDAIEAVMVSTSPFDARQGGFTGATVNAVTRSGSNQFRGSVYFLYRDQNLARTNLKIRDDQTSPVPDFKERTMGFTLGGPILQDRLWFFLSYERVREDRNPPTLNAPSAAQLFEEGVLARITAQANALGINLGGDADPDSQFRDDNILLRLDWQINQDHRLVFRYNDVQSERPTFPGYGGNNYSFQSHWYSQDIENTSYIMQLLSTWSDVFSTEVSISYNEYFSAPVFDLRQPQVVVQRVPLRGSNQTGNVSMGAERSRHFNRLEVDTWTVDLFGSYEINLNNTLTFGYQLTRADVFNAFVQDFLGTYTFRTPEDFELAGVGGWRGQFAKTFENPGVSAAAEFRESNHGLFVQNTYRPNTALTLTFGLRTDIPQVSPQPALNPAFQSAFGFANNETFSGNYVIQPRFGFNLRLDEEGTQQLRGGVGLFYGGLPRVWVSNSYSNTGLNFGTISLNRNQDVPAALDTPVFSNDPDNQPQLDPSALAARVAFIDPDFELPSRWKGVLAYDIRVNNLVFSLEGEFTQVNKDILNREINLAPDPVRSVAFDGREIFQAGRVIQPGFDRTYTTLLTNTNKGSSRNLSFTVERPRQEDGWYWRAAYINGRVREVQYGTSSVARSNWANRMILNQGEDIVSRGELEIRHRFIGIVQKDFQWSEAHRSTISLIYDGRSGLPFSFRASNDVNRDGISNNDLIFIPELGDPRVRFATPQDEATFNQLVDAWGLERGRVAPAGAGRYPFVHQFDLSLKHEIQLPGWRHRLELGLDILNVGNLLNSSWGLIKGSNSFFVKSESVAQAVYDPVTDTYTYSSVNERLANKDFATAAGRGEPNPSRWTGMLSVRYRF